MLPVRFTEEDATPVCTALWTHNNTGTANSAHTVARDSFVCNPTIKTLGYNLCPLRPLQSTWSAYGGGGEGEGEGRMRERARVSVRMRMRMRVRVKMRVRVGGIVFANRRI
jgi:hypothetical protein